MDSNPIRGTDTRQEPLIEIFVETRRTPGTDAHARNSSKKRCNQMIEYNFGYFVVSGYLMPDSGCDRANITNPSHGETKFKSYLKLN